MAITPLLLKQPKHGYSPFKGQPEPFSFAAL